MEPFATEVGGDHVRAAELWDDLGFRYDAALALLGSSDESLLRDALARLESLGAASTARLARQKMRTLGVRSVPSGVRATTKAHPAGLTRREHEVLELLCENLTNDEIAARLFLSVKTVDHHVSAVLGEAGRDLPEARGHRGGPARPRRCQNIGTSRSNLGSRPRFPGERIGRPLSVSEQHRSRSRQCRSTWMSTRSTVP